MKIFWKLFLISKQNLSSVNFSSSASQKLFRHSLAFRFLPTSFNPISWYTSVIEEEIPMNHWDSSRFIFLLANMHDILVKLKNLKEKKSQFNLSRTFPHNLLHSNDKPVFSFEHSKNVIQQSFHLGPSHKSFHRK